MPPAHAEPAPYDATPGVPEGSVVMIEGPRSWGNLWLGHPEARPGGINFMGGRLAPHEPCPVCFDSIAPGSDRYCPRCHCSGHDRRIDAHYEGQKARIAWEVERDRRRKEEELGTFATRHFGEKKSA